MSCLFQCEEVAVYGYLVFARVIRDGDYAAHTMTPVAENLNDKADIYHAAKCTGVRQRRHLARLAVWQLHRRSTVGRVPHHFPPAVPAIPCAEVICRSASSDR